MSSAGIFTGRHAAFIICGGFAIVIAVNFTMAYLATRSHPGLIVPNSYIASQKFNGWLAAGKAQKAMGWQVTATSKGDQLVVEARDAGNAALTGLAATAFVSHPLGQGEPVRITLTETAPGSYTGPHLLTPGQWQAEIRLSRGKQQHYLKQRLLVSG